MNDAWITTYTGKRFHPFNPKAEDVDIRDIAHALSMKCRFTGHCKTFVSVAQHSVLVCRNCENQKWGLLHDAAEAYLPDVASPLKKHFYVGSDTFSVIENRILAAVGEKFGIELPIPDDVHMADKIMLATEIRDFMPPYEPEPATEGVDPLSSPLVSWNCQQAHSSFMYDFHRLFGTY